VVEELPADSSSFTQGLEFASDGRLLESSGGYGNSSLREVDPATGRALRIVRLNPAWFAEGLTLADIGAGVEQLILLTWREGVAVYFDPVSLAEVGQRTYDGEGWGLCQLEEAGPSTPGELVMSDGTDTLTLRRANDFSATGSIRVTESGVPIGNLNELECVDGVVWANIWQSERIVAIDPDTGHVIATVDASGLLDRQRHPDADVLNGIAAIPGSNGEFLITGKRWPSSFRVRFADEP
jgi:glutaminyl-peptide cyclotransferase